MEKRVIVVCSIVGFLALLSVVTGFAAEATRQKGDHGQISASSSSCDYPTGPAFGLGLTSATALLIAEMTISFASGCICCCSKGPNRSKPHWTLALVCFVVSWFGCFVSFMVLLQGAFLNVSYDGHEIMSLGYYVCPSAKPGAFAGAAVLSFVSLMLGLVYYLIMIGDKKPLGNTQGGIAMGQPQFPSHANARDPVFVQEDIHVQREFV